MNSLEFINIEIAIVKSNYKKHICFGQTNLAIADENRLKYLQQIKNELEAWEVVKEKFFIDIIERDNDCKIGFEPKTPIINGTVTRFAQLDNYQGTIIKKSLEVNK